MAKALKTVGMIAGAVALVATGVGAFAVAGAGIAGIGSFTAIASIAGVVAGVANLGANALAKPPPARGSVTQTQIDPDHPTPYVMGEGYYAGVLRSRAGYGATVKKVPNPNLWEVWVYSTGGPIQGPISPRFDFAPVPSFYSGFFAFDSQLGATPEASELVPPYGAAPGWGAAYKLSGQAAIGWQHKFDKDAKRYANGLPVRGAYAKWVKVYDPRKDDTFPGGVGAHRLGNESTYEWSENPALHAGTYAFGRYQNGQRVFGMGLPKEAIDFEAIAAWASDCEANGWTLYGVIYEPGDRWANLREICIAGGGEPLPLNTGIGFHWDRPRVVLDTITEDDAGQGEAQVTAMQSYRDRINRIVPEFTSEAHNWELVKAEPLIVTEYVEQDGETVSQTYPFNLVKDPVQAGELAAYKLVNAREFYPITLPLKPRMRHARPGECYHLDRPDLGLDTPAVLLKRQPPDPITGEVVLTFIGETAAKHAYALGQTATPPPIPALGQTAEERDELAAAANNPAGLDTLKLSGSYTRGLAGNVTQTNNGDGTVTVTIPNHTRVYADGSEVSVTGATLVLPETSDQLIYYDDEAFAGGAVTYETTTTAADAYFSAANPYRHFIAYVTTVDSGGGGGSVGGSSPPGGGGWDSTTPAPNVP
ncbi:hypothetical protein [Aurantiacibacter luteus]|uniref:hypothetical protein n=1 Tax=Aurantiacibacter luteus TaxID=1581420 RepID=UPI00069C13C0|nr:hypothetical protein [Aurantiacibacter luteus]